jgi:hypothetical protein
MWGGHEQFRDLLQAVFVGSRVEAAQESRQSPLRTVLWSAVRFREAVRVQQGRQWVRRAQASP